MDLENLLRTKEITLKTTGETITIRELAFGPELEIQEAIKIALADGDPMEAAKNIDSTTQKRIGTMTVYYGVPALQEKYTMDQVEQLMPTSVVEEISQAVTELGGSNDVDVITGNLEGDPVEG